MSDNLLILDPTLRDGSHAIKHQLTPDNVAGYVKLADEAGINIIEVGHGLGLGASSSLSGISRYSDSALNQAALNNSKTADICNFVLPGFATLTKDIIPAMEQGVKTFRFGTHCTEADLSKNHIKYVTDHGGKAYTSLIMSHMVDAQTLLKQARKLQEYGAVAVTLMDSAGSFSLSETKEKISTLVDNLDIKIGYHGHNNLGLSVANSVIAAQSGATIVDATARGFGAGAGNTPIEAMIAALHKEGFETDVDLTAVILASNYAESNFIQKLPVISDEGVIGGFYGICGAFQKHIVEAAKQYDVSVTAICKELSVRKAVAGQEDMIIEVAATLKGKNND